MARCYSTQAPRRTVRLDREGISRGAAFTVVVVSVLVAVSMVAVFAGWSPGAPPNSSSETTSTSASPSSSSGGLTISNMYADVRSSDEQALYSNSSSVAGKTTFKGSPGETFLVMVDIVYQACGVGACPKQIAAVSAATPGFTVVSITPSLPLALTGAGGDFLEGGLTVVIRAPPTPYTGDLTLVVQA
jgi:hypothetical protein